MPFKSDKQRRTVMAMIAKNNFRGLLVETRDLARIPARKRGKIYQYLEPGKKHRWIGLQYDENVTPSSRDRYHEITPNQIARIIGYTKSGYPHSKDIEFDKPIEMPIRLRKRKGNVYGI